MADRFVQFAHMRQRDGDGQFTAVVWDRELEAASKAQAKTRPKARRLAMNAAETQAATVTAQVAAFFSSSGA